jgi:hypothetical protein
MGDSATHTSQSEPTFYSAFLNRAQRCSVLFFNAWHLYALKFFKENSVLF